MTHSVAPAVSWNDPAAHAEQTLAPAVEYMPAGHAAQPFVPELISNVPAAQIEHWLTPGDAYDPAAQRAQLDDPEAA